MWCILRKNLLCAFLDSPILQSRIHLVHMVVQYVHLAAARKFSRIILFISVLLIPIDSQEHRRIVLVSIEHQYYAISISLDQ